MAADDHFTGHPAGRKIDPQGSLPLEGNGRAEARHDHGGSRPAWLDELERKEVPSSVGPEAEPGPAAPAPGGRTPEPRRQPPVRREEGAGRAPAPVSPARAAAPEGEMDRALGELRAEARHAARIDGEQGIPSRHDTHPPASEVELRERCRAYFERWLHDRKRETLEAVSVAEERAAEKLGRISLGIDRFQRITNEMIRLKARYSVRRDEVTRELASEGKHRPRGIPTKVYALALVFLGLVEFFANAPVFAALLPRDPLTERQIRVLTEMSEGWFAGAERVLAQLVFRPDAALLAAGVITFLCVLAHFFGSSLRELVMQREVKDRRYTVQGRSALENAVPLVLTSIGLILVLGVLYQSRIDLGEVGEERYVQDMAQVEELRREAGWLRVDGELLAANDLTNRGDDLQAAAVELREYSYSMARMSFPILLLNLTLVLCAISAAYFHRRDARREHFNETPFEEDRRNQIETAEEVASDTSKLLAEVGRDIRGLTNLTAMGPGDGWRSVAHQLEAVITLYRVENGRVQGVEPRSLPAFAGPPGLDLNPPESGMGLVTRSPADYEEERAALARRFEEVRVRFNEESAASW